MNREHSDSRQHIVGIRERKSRTVSSFLKKTYQLLNDEQNHHAVKWAPNGIGFIVLSQQDFAQSVLPHYFRHNNYSSFVRQLNMYSFHKIRESNSQSYFHHESFDRSCEAKLSQIKRKPQKKKKRHEDEDSEPQVHVQIKHEPRTTIKKGKENIGMVVKKRNQVYHSYKPSVQLIGHFETSKISDGAISSQKNTRPFFSQNNNGSKQEHQEIMLYQQQEQDDKLSINNSISERIIPRVATCELINPSNNNLFPFAANHQTSTFCKFY